MLEEQLVASHIRHAELDEVLCICHEVFVGVTLVDQFGLAFGKALGGFAEHRVEDGVLGVEVRVDGRCRDARLPRQVTQRQSSQAVGADHLPRRCKDGGSRGLAARSLSK